MQTKQRENPAGLSKLTAAMQQRYTTISLLLQGFINFPASLILGKLFGGIGVALDTLIGAVVGVSICFWYSMPRTRSLIDVARLQLFGPSFAIPEVCLSPAVAMTVWALLRGSVLWQVFLVAWLVSVGPVATHLEITASLNESGGRGRTSHWDFREVRMPAEGMIW